MDQVSPILAQIGSKGSIWLKMTQHGSTWLNVAQSGSMWLILAQSGSVGLIGSVGLSWPDRLSF